MRWSERHPMKTTIWLLFALLALIWTGGIALTAELVQLAAPALASGSTVDLAELVSRWPMPALAALGVDPALLPAAVASVLAGLDGALAFVGSAAGWITPLLWLCWTVGMVLMLVLTIVSLLLLARLARTASASA